MEQIKRQTPENGGYKETDRELREGSRRERKGEAMEGLEKEEDRDGGGEPVKQ